MCLLPKAFLCPKQRQRNKAGSSTKWAIKQTKNCHQGKVVALNKKKLHQVSQTHVIKKESQLCYFQSILYRKRCVNFLFTSSGFTHETFDE